MSGKGIEDFTFTEKDLNSILPKQALCQEVLAVILLGVREKKQWKNGLFFSLIQPLSVIPFH